MKHILNGWHFARWIRLFIGLYILIQGIMDSQWWFAALGLLFTLMPVFNVGCCGGSCATSASSQSMDNRVGVIYEEVKSKQQ